MAGLRARAGPFPLFSFRHLRHHDYYQWVNEQMKLERSKGIGVLLWVSKNTRISEHQKDTKPKRGRDV